ncbi:TetR/AcrR family transcriptional regulator [Paraglaciecola polaris]|uniref:TetR family transcriptional regulator n=1 Tax=Paraglaciecola polaris LMG 21857 TaxID=1129793 RepID=K6ZUZ0_9ALTE|nr:TetR family transcriptional regulator [Paraglaciecola polaris LMG 21857]
MNKMRNIRKGTGESRRGKETILLILNSAKTILIEQGYSKLSMRKVAVGAEISVGNLQYYYPSKNDLLKDLLDHSIDEFMNEFERLRVGVNNDPELHLRSIINFIVLDLGNPTTTTFYPELWALANHDEYADKLMDQIYARVRLPLEDCITRINPKLSVEQVKKVALFISASMEGMTMFVGNGKVWNDSIKQMANIAIMSFLQMVKKITPEDIDKVL